MEPTERSQWSNEHRQTTISMSAPSDRLSSWPNSHSQNHSLYPLTPRQHQQHQQHQPDTSNFSPNDWNSLFSTPINPSLFASLAANGVLGPIPTSPPPTSFRTPNSFNPAPQRTQIDAGTSHNNNQSHSAQSTLWSSYSDNSQYAHKHSVPTRTSNSLSHPVKGKTPLTGLSHFTTVHPRTSTLDSRSSDPTVSATPTIQNVDPTRQYANPIRHHSDDTHLAYGPGPSPHDFSSFTGVRPSHALPPTLWMSPASHPHTQYDHLNHLPLSIYPTLPDSLPPGYVNSPTSPNSTTTDSKSALFTDIFSDDLFASTSGLQEQAPSPFTSPTMSGSPDLLNNAVVPDADPERLAKDDPLATQVWKMYARTKATLPHAQRMENITWRMMALALKKKKEEEEARLGDVAPDPNPSLPIKSEESTRESDERGRRIDKGKARVRVVGFDGANQDGIDDEE
jgi:GATA-binding protein